MKWINAVINSMEVSIAFDNNSIHIYNAFPIKDNLKMRGYRWNPADKSWYKNPDNVEAEVELLKNNLNSPKASILNNLKSEHSKFPASHSVSELRNRIDRLIQEGIGGSIWVRGLIASEVKNYKWSSYLDLTDEDEGRDLFFRVEIKKQQLEEINRKLKDSGVAQSLEKDLPIFCRVNVLLPFRNVVDIRLSMLEILPEYTQAKIRNQQEITLAKLKEEGILGNQKKMILPSFISRIGLITSENGTSIRDIKAGLHPYESKYQFYFVDSRMEGTHAIDSIIQAINFLENNKIVKLDMIIIARGGGSEQSLAIFNDFRLCQKVCKTNIPILAAIGHEKDTCALEQCSWFSPTPSTPSGLGKYLQNRYLNLQDLLTTKTTNLINYFTQVHLRELEKISSFLKNIPSQALNNLKLKEERFLTLIHGLEKLVSFTVRDQERRIENLANLLIKKNLSLIQKNKKNLETCSESIISRANTLNQRGLQQTKKTIGRLDLNKKFRDNRKEQLEILEKARNLFLISHKNYKNTYRDLKSCLQLVQANDPQRILKKGFTLTLDKENHVIKSLIEFNQKKAATLKFHDGLTEIEKKGGMMSKHVQSRKYEDNYAILERITESLNKDEVGIDDLVIKTREALDAARACMEILDKQKGEFKKLETEFSQLLKSPPVESSIEEPGEVIQDESPNIGQDDPF